MSALRASNTITRMLQGMHVYRFVCEHEGTQEWVCPVCGRVALIEFSPFCLIAMSGENVAHAGFEVRL